MPMPPGPMGVEMATIVSSSVYVASLLSARVSLRHQESVGETVAAGAKKSWGSR